MVVCVFRTNQALSKDSKVREANLESLQRQLTSAQADNSAVAKAKEDVVRQLAQKTEHVNKLLPLEATNNQLKEQVQGLQTYYFHFFFLFCFSQCLFRTCFLMMMNRPSGKSCRG